MQGERAAQKGFRRPLHAGGARLLTECSSWLGTVPSALFVVLSAETVPDYAGNAFNMRVLFFYLTLPDCPHLEAVSF